MLGETICCVHIFQSDKEEGIPASWAHGHDVMVDSSTYILDDSKILLEKNFCDRKFVPGAPICTVRGKEIPAMIFCSAHSGGTMEIFVCVVEKFDDIKLFDCNVATPVLLLDGHKSCLDPIFLDYIKNKQWIVVLGVVHGTSFWQVADSSKGNGCVKWYFDLGKQKLLKYKIQNGFGVGFSKEDFVLLVKKAWAKLFAVAQQMKKAVAVRGWNPLNCVCLSHPEIAPNEETSRYFSRTVGGNHRYHCKSPSMCRTKVALSDNTTISDQNLSKT